MPKITMLMPSYGKVEPETMISALVMSLNAPDLLCAIRNKNLMYVDRARNELVKESLDDESTHFLWLDSDMLWPPDMIRRLVEHNKPVVGANYFTKMTAQMVPGNFADGHKIARLTELPVGLVPCDCLGMGACLIEKDVFLKMREHYKDERWFRCGDDNDFFGEDNWFFYRLKQMGIPVYLDGDLNCGHLSPCMMVTVDHWKAKWGIKKKWPDSPGDPCDFEDLYREVVETLPRGSIAVEVGSFLGRSAILFAKLLKEKRDRFYDVAFHCVDHFKGSDDEIHRQIIKENGGSFRQLFEKNLTDAGMRDCVNVIEGDSADSAKHFGDGECNFVFIDAEHDFRSVCRDIRAWLPKICKGGILAGHDFDWIGVRQAVNLLLPDAKPHGKHCWIWRK